MGTGNQADTDFDAWLERSLRRELGRAASAAAPARAWVTLARRRRHGLALASGAGGALGAKAATGLVVAVFATAATGTAVTGTANPVAWGEALETAALTLPDRIDAPTTTPSSEAKPAATPVDRAPAVAAAPVPTAAGSPAPKHTPRAHASPAPKRHGRDSSD